MAFSRKRSFEQYRELGEDSSSRDIQHGLHSRKRESGYAADASIVLLGIRGTGKSSLAFLVSSTYNRSVIEYERAFQSRTGCTPAEHCQQYKDSDGRKKRKEILQSVLESHNKNAVIVCDFSELAHGASVLQAYGKSHPVIHVSRDASGLQTALRDWPETTVAHLLKESAGLLRKCSTHDFLNLTEQSESPGVDARVSTYINDSIGGAPSGTNPQSLRLKRTERDFLKFLRLILGDHDRSPYQQSAYPLSSLPLEVRKHTYAVALTIDEAIADDLDFESVQIGADALAIDVMYIGQKNTDRDITKLSAAFSKVRRSTVLPVILMVPADHPDRPTTLDACRRLVPEYLIVHIEHHSSQWGIAAARQNSKTRVLSSMTCPTSTNFASIIDSFDSQSDGLLLTATTAVPECSEEIQHARLRWYTKYGKSRMLSLSVEGANGRFSQVMNDGLLLVRAQEHSGSKSVLSAHVATLTAAEITKALFSCYHFSALSFCIVGANVDFSLSPAMHNAAYASLGMPHHFTTKSTPSLDILRTLSRNEEFGGAAITQPFKISITDKLNSLSEHARIIGAVNTVLPLRRTQHLDIDLTIGNQEIVTSRNERGMIFGLRGDNTDWIGMRACLRRGLSPINAVRPSSTGLVVGAGGMARAAIYALISMGVQNIFVWNRTNSTAQSLADYYNTWLRQRSTNTSEGSEIVVSCPTVTIIPSLDSPWPTGYRHPTMIISSIPAESVNGRPEGTFTLPSQWMSSPSGGVVIDLTYNPLVTALVRQVKAEAHRGWIIMTGLDMLPEQAFAQFELFTGRRAPRKVMQMEVLKAFQELNANANANGQSI